MSEKRRETVREWDRERERVIATAFSSECADSFRTPPSSKRSQLTCIYLDSLPCMWSCCGCWCFSTDKCTSGADTLTHTYKSKSTPSPGYFIIKLYVCQMCLFYELPASHWVPLLVCIAFPVTRRQEIAAPLWVRIIRWSSVLARCLSGLAATIWRGRRRMGNWDRQREGETTVCATRGN